MNIFKKIVEMELADTPLSPQVAIALGVMQLQSSGGQIQLADNPLPAQL